MGDTIRLVMNQNQRSFLPRNSNRAKAKAAAGAGVGAEIVARVQSACFDALDAPVLRVTNRDVPQPYATNLEKLVLPNVQRILLIVQYLRL